MGRRSVSTTKSGKFMNPTDQARKEARKKELKKNKKQRLLVRTAVLKNKDPGLIIQELDKLDEIEFNPVEAPSLAEKVLKDKRKKLRETLERVMKLYQKEDPTLWNELKAVEGDYERRRFQRIQYFEAVKQAESISVEDIPLPSNNPPSVSDIPLPADDPIPEPASILKKSNNNDQESPGVPPGSPPGLTSGDEESDLEEESSDDKETERLKTKKSVHFDDLDQFMKEVEEEFKTIEEELQPPGIDKSNVNISSTVVPFSDHEAMASSAVAKPQPPTVRPPPPPQQIPQQHPPNRMHFYGQQPPPAFPRVRVPFPHRLPQPVQTRPSFNYRARFKSTVYTSGPLINPQQRDVISAKPQIRSLSADVTRFVPVAVKTSKSTVKDDLVHHKAPQPNSRPNSAIVPQPGPSKDDAYAEFMKEMAGLL
ncbi:unnamed protein product [Allacma fusca]|uniref:Wbp11/ELF5/Saf1 N-terminal domain-containing protein n=1 Tax=Allacma fusca TaxID=39272 RepID=A0A8J2JWM6_9HEXA|nr:unnamed protein product [Allacma fusca]